MRGKQTTKNLGTEREAPKTQWFARAGDIKRMGPFASHVEAARAVIGLDGAPVEGAFVWPELRGRHP